MRSRCWNWRRRAQDAVAELESSPRGELAIAANEATCIYVLPKVFSEYRQLFPAVQLQVLRSYGARVVEAVMENSADFGLTQLPVDEKRLQVVNIYHDEIRLIVPARHPLSDKKSVMPQDLVEHFLILPKQGKTRTRLNEWLEPVEDDIRISMELDSTEMMKRFVIAGLGASFLAVSNCGEEIAAGKLLAISLAPERMVRRLGLIYRKDKALSKAALGFIQVVLEQMGEETSQSDDLRPLREGFRRSGSPVPHCGEAQAGAKGLFQTSTVLISSGGADMVYRTVEEIPRACERGC